MDRNQDSSIVSLSYDVRRSFETVSEIHIAQKRFKTQDDNTDEKVVKDSEDKDILQKKKCEAAIDAAVAAESAIVALSNGIAELEDLLSREDAIGTQPDLNPDVFKTSANVPGNENMKHTTS